MKVGSLFSGIGGLDLGLERAGMEIRWQVEIDPFCRKVLAKHWPNVPCYEDVRDVGVHNLEPVDLVCGGFPCQDISLARTWDSGGSHLEFGLGGTRSGLWWEMLRVVSELEPRLVLVENVSALSVRGLDLVVGSLSDARYDAEWSPLGAYLFGAPHTRERTFIVAYPHSERREQARILLGPLAGEAFPQASEWELGGTVCRVDGKAPIAAALGVDDGIPAGLDRAERMTALGNAVVPQVAEWIGRRIMEAAA